MAEEGTEGAVNVRLRFTTREESLRLPNEAPILVPTSFKRYQLSQYINTQLALGQSVPFEFLINGTYLRTSIDEFLAENGISAETTLNVEYVRARIPPQWVANYQHDDWVSDVHTSTVAQPDQAVSRILTASYDGRLRVWNTSSQVIATSPSAGDGGHLSFVKSARYVSATQIASAGFDRTVRLWKYSEADDGSSATIAPALELYGHTGSVDSVDTHAQSHRILTASADHSVRLWSTRKTDAPQAPENLIPNAVTKEGKRRKLNPSVSVPRRGAIAAMDAHTAAVSAARFDVKDSTVAYSASQDHTVRTWDLVTSALVDTRTTSNPLFCIEQMPALNLLATGTAGRDVKLVDPRASAATVIAMSLKGHKNHVVSLARDPDNEYVLASGSHDGTCRIWDLRSTKNNKDGVTSQSIYTIARASLQGKATPPTGEGVKVFGVCWDRSIGLLTAGEDKNVQVNSSDSMS